MIRRLWLVALLGYVALDLSLPAMPGAFVFDPSGSVESVDGGRVRSTDKTVALLTPTPQSSLPARRPLLDGGRLAGATHRSRHVVRSIVSCLPRAACPAPPPSEDPH